MNTPPIIRILEHLGLSEVMSDFNRDYFQTYVPKDYRGSERASMDAVYRMGEVVLLHKATGLRLEYLTTESYYGDEVRYRLRSIFIITASGNKLDVVNVDFEKGEVLTPKGIFPMSGIYMEPDTSDGDNSL
ncbi:MAG: hypothetical protein ACK4RF_06135 [Cyclobacteriaceae bacterium]